MLAEMVGVALRLLADLLAACHLEPCGVWDQKDCKVAAGNGGVCYKMRASLGDQNEPAHCVVKGGQSS